MSIATILAPAKLNLYLKIGKKQADGIHKIESLFFAVSFGDTLSVEVSPSRKEKPDVKISMHWHPLPFIRGEGLMPRPLGRESNGSSFGTLGIKPESNSSGERNTPLLA
ncbi:MAG: hypothetical protein FWH41_06875, partial [Treponema sp.]|nr:hypothetical protein [Treponema sp.]